MSKDQTSGNSSRNAPSPKTRAPTTNNVGKTSNTSTAQHCHEPNDLDLIEQIQAGDEDAFATLYDRYSSLIFAVCLRINRDHMDAEEALLDTFLQLWEHPDRFDPTRGSVRGYLLVAARSRALDRRRQSGKHAHQSSTILSDPPAANSTGESTTPCDGAAYKESRTRLLEAMQDLNADQRELVELSFFDGLSHRQIAESKEQPLGTVKTRIRQALIQLRDSLRTLNREDVP